MNMDRRKFFKIGALTAGMIGLDTLSNTCSGSSNSVMEVPFNLSFQEGISPGKDLNEKLDYMESMGIVGLEPNGRNLARRVNELQQALRGRKIKVSVICIGFSGWLIAENAEVRKRCMETSMEIMAAGAELGALGMILVPGFNRQQPSLPMPQSRELLVEQLNELGEFGVKHNTTLILEPLNRGEAWYLRLVADGAAIAKDTGSAGVTLMGDFWHMTWEETSDMGAFISAGKYLQHVHMASRKNRLMPGEDGEADNYVEGFRGLKIIGYDKYVSFECGSRAEDRNASAIAAVELLRKQWEEA